MTDTRETHTFAWDGMAFDVPRDWHLSNYVFTTRESSLQMQDATSVRLEAEWTRSRRTDADTVLKRYRKKAGAWEAIADETSAIDRLPPHWTGFAYRMPENRILMVAFYLHPSRSLAVLFRLHFENTGKHKAMSVFRGIAGSFTWQDRGTIPWTVYDMHVALPREFRLVETGFEAGRKLMVFEWRLRRLLVWRFSLAHLALREKTLDAWAADVLNTSKLIKGPRFVPDGRGGLQVGRNRRYGFRHYEEIGRWCFRYRALYVHDPQADAIKLAVYQYRVPGDLTVISDLEKSMRGA
jgi:hypothetical protein